jgi:hypothetical protein
MVSLQLSMVVLVVTVNACRARRSTDTVAPVFCGFATTLESSISWNKWLASVSSSEVLSTALTPVTSSLCTYLLSVIEQAWFTEAPQELQVISLKCWLRTQRFCIIVTFGEIAIICYFLLIVLKEFETLFYCREDFLTLLKILP